MQSCNVHSLEANSLLGTSERFASAKFPGGAQKATRSRSCAVPSPKPVSGVPFSSRAIADASAGASSAAPLAKAGARSPGTAATAASAASSAQAEVRGGAAAVKTTATAEAGATAAAKPIWVRQDGGIMTAARCAGRLLGLRPAVGNEDDVTMAMRRKAEGARQMQEDHHECQKQQQQQQQAENQRQEQEQQWTQQQHQHQQQEQRGEKHRQPWKQQQQQALLWLLRAPSSGNRVRQPSTAPLRLRLLLLLLLSSVALNGSPAAGQNTTTSRSSTNTVKWTFLIYMLADNNLECFGLLDLIEMMQGMAKEPSDCQNTACGAACPAGYTTTASSSCGGGKSVSRCCASAAYPDVLVLADRGVSACPVPTVSGLDLSLLSSTWTTAKELLVLPGGIMQQVRDLGEIDMASSDQLAAFLQRAFARFPSSSSSGTSSTTTTRKYALVMWDHGNGWKGYGVDDQCSATGGVSDSGCDQFTLVSLARGLAAGLAGQAVSKLDLLGFDACLMSMYEVAGALAPYARTLLGSEMLEPGHGWDYAALGAMTAAMPPPTEEVELAQIWISRYKAQAVAYGTTGITMALSDLSATTAQLMPAVGALADALCTALKANSTYASGVLRRRMAMAAVGTGEQESSVDLGSVLSELCQASDLDAASRAAATAAAAAYNATLLAFGRDDAMPASTGLAIYFPTQAVKMDSDYLALTSTPAAILSATAGRWAAFLTALYDATTAMASSATSFSFLQSSAASVPYIDVASGSYVLQGVLNSPLALSALSYYGFVDATDKSYILAGSQPAVVDGLSVVGTWRRILWGITQTLTTTTTTTTSNTTPNTTTITTSTLLASSASSSLSSTSFSALMFAAESWTTSSDGTTAASVSLTANVRYGDTCSSSRNATSSAILQYTYRFSSRRATLQLFAQQASGAYGEVSAQAGGVIVPLMYKLPRDFSGAQSITYEYSGCLKWGYNGTVRIVPVAMDDAADTLGVDVREDMLMFLVARDLSLTKAAYLVGSFTRTSLSDTTVGGCQCLTRWKMSGDATGATYSGCAIPDGDPRGPWCPVLAGSCTQPDAAQGAITDASQPWDYCSPSRTLAACSCASKYAVDATNRNFAYGKCYRGDDRAVTRGAWCTVNTSTCPSSYRAHGSNDTSYDYCETPTMEGCYCVNSWTYNGVTYNGTCATGFYPDLPPEGFTNSSRWCQVQPGCATRYQLGGRRIGLCGLAVPRQAGPSNATCVLPAAVSGGIVVHDCVPWRNGPAAMDRADGISPVCPLDVSASTFGTCVARSCTALDLSSCPATSPQNTAAVQSSAWVSRPCLEQLCAAVLVSRDNSTCAVDGARAAVAFSQLNASTEVKAVLRSNYYADSLDAFCTARHGTDCLPSLMLTACPAIRLNGTAMYDTAYVDDSNTAGSLCRTDCLKALCAVASTNCARRHLVESLRLTLLEAMDAKCRSSGLMSGTGSMATNISFNSLTASLMCTQLMRPSSTCAQITTLTSATGNISLGPVTGTSQYAPLTNCTWRIAPTGLSYINLTFTSFSTEPLYDSLRVEDADGLVALLSGDEQGGPPGPLVTDTGLLVLIFTSDSSIEMSGFTAAYTAAVARSLPKPSCGSRQKLVMFTMRTAEYGNEDSWVVGGFRILSTNGSSSSSSSGAMQRVMLAAGGQLPATALAMFPSSNVSLVSTDAQYRNSRPYTTYACLPTGLSTLYMFDGYGDGWTDGSLKVSYMPTSDTSYTLLNATLTGLNSTLPLQILATMPGTAAAYSAALASNKGSGRFSVRMTVRLSGEATGASAISDLKQLFLRGAVSAVMSVDVTAVSVQSMSAAGNISSGSSSSSGRRSRSLVEPTFRADVTDGIGADGKVGPLVSGAHAYVTSDEATSASAATAEVAAEEPEAAAGNDSSGGGSGSSEVLIAGVLSTGPVEDRHATGGDLSAPGVQEHDRSTAAGAAATAAGGLTSEKKTAKENQEEEDMTLVHGPGVVEVLMARARELGLRPQGPGERADSGGGADSNAAMAAAAALQRQQLRRRRRGRVLQATPLTELLSDQELAGSNLAAMVSVQQPYVLWSKDALAAAAVTTVSGTGTATGAAPESAPSSGGAAAKIAAPSAIDPTGDDTGYSLNSSSNGAGTSSNNSSSGGDGSDDGDSSSAGSSSNSSSDNGGLEIPAGYTVLPNGLMVGPDGVPLVRKGSARASASATTSIITSVSVNDSSSNNSSSDGGSVNNSTAVPRTLVSVGSDSVGAATAAAATTGRLAAERQVSALDAMEEMVAAMRRNAERAAAGSQPPHMLRGDGRNGGRTPVPALQQLLPELLRRGAPHLARLAEATANDRAAAEGDAARGGSGGGGNDGGGNDVGGNDVGGNDVGGNDGGGNDGGGNDVGGAAAPHNDMDELMRVARSHGGGEAGWRMSAARDAASSNAAASATSSRILPSDVAMAAAGPMATATGGDSGCAGSSNRHATAELAGAVATVADAEVADGMDSAGAAARDRLPTGDNIAKGLQDEDEEKEEAELEGAPSWQLRRRQLQQTTAAVDAVLVVTGYATLADAEAAAAKLQSIVGSDLRDVLGDAGWTYAAPSLVGAVQVLEGGQPVTQSTSSSSGHNWSKLAIIIGAAAGGGLLLLALVALVWYLMVRSRGSNGTLVAPGKTIKVAPAPSARPPPAPHASKTPLLQAEADAKAKAQLQMEVQTRMEMQQEVLLRQQQQLQMMQQQLAMRAASTRSGASLLGPGPAAAAAAAAAASGRPPGGMSHAIVGGESRRAASLAARGPALGPWMNPAAAEAAASMAAAAPAANTPIAPMYGGGLPGMPYSSQAGMDPYSMAAMDPYGMAAMSQYGMYGDPYGVGAMGYDPYGAYGDPYVGAYPAPPGAWGGAGPGMPRMGWQ